MCVATTFCHVVLHLGKDYLTYRQIAEWLGDYRYTPPAERVVVPELGYALLQFCNGDLQKAYHHTFITQHFDTETQKKIAKWISDSSNSHTPAC